MAVSRDALHFLIAEGGAAGPLAARFMNDIESAVTAIERGSIVLRDETLAHRVLITVALSLATRETVNDVLTVSAASELLHPRYRRERGYDTWVTRALLRNRRAAIETAHGADAVSALTDPIWHLVGREYVATLQRSYDGFFAEMDQSLMIDATFGTAAIIAYAAAYARAGDAAGYAEMRPLLRLISSIIPIGSPKGSDGLWLVLVA